MENNLFYIAIIPNNKVIEEVRKFQLIVSEEFNSSKSLTHIPHITIIPPFHIPISKTDFLVNVLTDFRIGFQQIEIVLDGFSHFKNHTIFIEVNNNQLLVKFHETLKKELNNTPELLPKQIHYFDRFQPHITIAYKDLKPNFKNCWSYFSELSFTQKFECNSFYLFNYENSGWQIFKTFNFH